MRPIGIEVASRGEVERALVAREHEFVRQRGLLPGQDTILLLDPAGNWIEISERKLVG